MNKQLSFDQELELMTKCKRVILSCKTRDQRVTSDEYVKLALKRINDVSIRLEIREYQHTIRWPLKT